MTDVERILIEAEAAAARAKLDVLERRLEGDRRLSAPRKRGKRGPTPVLPPDAPASAEALERADQVLRKKGFRVR